MNVVQPENDLFEHEIQPNLPKIGKFRTFLDSKILQNVWPFNCVNMTLSSPY